jgi:hypothetical protein
MKDDTYEVIRRERLNGVALEELIGVKNINFEYDRNTTHDCVWDEIILLGDYEKPSKEAFEAKLQELIDAQPLNELRAARDALLEKTDKYATIDFPHGSEAAKQAWLDYRQTLRDLPANTTDPENPIWPEAPTP